MVARISFIKTALVFSSTLAISLLMTALPSVAQAQLSAGVEVKELSTEQFIEIAAELDAADDLPNLASSPSTETETSAPEVSTSEAFALQTETPQMDALALPAPGKTVLASEASTVVELEITAAEGAIPLKGIAEIPDSESAISHENIAQPTNSAENSEVAMAELAEALNADMAEIQAMAKPSELAAQTLESAEVVAAVPRPGASVLGDLNSVGLENSALVAENPLSEIEADAVPALKAALSSDNTLTQLYAADALWTLTRDSDLVLPALISAATSGSFETRELANIGLSYLGRQALPAIPFLNRMLGDRDSNVRTIVQDTLEIVGSNNRPATTLGILAREVAQRPGLIPTALNVITRLWR